MARVPVSTFAGAKVLWQDGEGVSLGDTVPPRANLFTSGRARGSWGKRETRRNRKKRQNYHRNVCWYVQKCKILKDDSHIIRLLGYVKKEARRKFIILWRRLWGQGWREKRWLTYRMDSSHRCGQIMTGRLVLYNIFTGNPPNSLSLSSSYERITQNALWI